MGLEKPGPPCACDRGFRPRCPGGVAGGACTKGRPPGPGGRVKDHSHAPSWNSASEHPRPPSGGRWCQAAESHGTRAGHSTSVVSVSSTVKDASCPTSPLGPEASFSEIPGASQPPDPIAVPDPPHALEPPPHLPESSFPSLGAQDRGHQNLETQQEGGEPATHPSSSQAGGQVLWASFQQRRKDWSKPGQTQKPLPVGVQPQLSAHPF